MMMGAGCVSSCFGCGVVRGDSIAAAVINKLLPGLPGAATAAVTKMQCLAGAMATAASRTAACTASRR